VAELFAARVRPPEAAAAREVLDPALYSAFEQMPPEDRHHGLEMLAAVRDAGVDAPPLLAAALLHDVGKANAGVGLWPRVLRVLLAGTVPGLWNRLASSPTGWRRPFWVVANHPERGAVWVASLGGSPELVDLIRHHESDAPAAWPAPLRQWHAILAAADKWH
jgi:hypothetical protein